jgi:hypothetical protein
MASGSWDDRQASPKLTSLLYQPGGTIIIFDGRLKKPNLARLVCIVAKKGDGHATKECQVPDDSSLGHWLHINTFCTARSEVRTRLLSTTSSVLECMNHSTACFNTLTRVPSSWSMAFSCNCRQSHHHISHEYLDLAQSLWKPSLLPVGIISLQHLQFTKWGNGQAIVKTAP